MKLSGSTKVNDLLQKYPFLEDFLASRSTKLEMLKHRMARATIGRVATLATAAGIADIDLNTLLQDLADEIERQTGIRPEMEGDVADESMLLTREQRLEELKQIISDLHAGGDIQKARERFAKAVQDVEASEIAEMEEDLIKGGLPVTEVQRLCDVHVSAFRHALDEHAEVETPPGHPVHTYLADNKIIADLADSLACISQEIAAGIDVDGNLRKSLVVLGRLGGVENHYQRKENELFPVLERHSVTGPTKVMWGVHDKIRETLKEIRAAAEKEDIVAFTTSVPGFTRDLVEMIYKEEKILLPLAMETLTQEEWTEIRRGEDELGYLLVKPAAPWPPGGAKEGVATAAPASAAGREIAGLKTGDVSLEQLNLILSHLPVDLTYIDENDTVRFYSEGPSRIFPRTPSIIGRKVQNCHPPKSVHVVQDIVDSFRSGRHHMAEFWIQMHGRFIHIRYFPVRDHADTYRGCIEVTQDITGIRKLEGERRLLSWETAGSSSKTGHGTACPAPCTRGWEGKLVPKGGQDITYDGPTTSCSDIRLG